MKIRHRVDWSEVATFGLIGAGICVLVLALPNLIRYTTVIGLSAFLVVNAVLAVKQRRFAVALAFAAVTVFAFVMSAPIGLELAYVSVLSVILRRSIRTDAANAAPAYILFGYEESRYDRSGFHSGT